MSDEPIEMPDAASWREWLAEHHLSTTAVWLIFFKKHTRRVGLSYDEAVEQALCFGWIDSMVRRLDDDRTIQKFTPRRQGSPWSESNRLRARKLIDSGQMTPAGLRLVPPDLL